MLSYVIKRILWAIPTLFGVSILVFSMVHLASGDPALLMLGEHANKESVDILREQLGLNKPLIDQYFIFLNNILHGDFGISTISGEPVIDEFMARLPATIELGVFTTFFALIIGISAGLISAVKRYSIFDYSAMTVALAGVSMPVFWLGLLLIYFFAVNLGWSPVSGRLSYTYDIDHITGFFLIDSILTDNWGAFWDALKHLILPSIAFGTVIVAIVARITRGSMLDVIKEEYIKTAKAKGCSNFQVVFIHAFRNAFLPVLTVIGGLLAAIVAGAVLTETTFSWPGIGKWLVNAVNQRDFPIIQATTIIITTVFVVFNIIIDTLYAVVNPRIRLS